MDPISILPDTHSPRVEFSLDGNLLFEGRSIPNDIFELFDPLFKFAINLSVEQVVFDINLEYFNTSTSKAMLDLLEHLDTNKKIAKVLVNWHYEENDVDGVEMAEIYEECMTRTEFKYCSYPELVCLADLCNEKPTE